MEKGVNNPHDKFFKALLSDKESAVAFLKLSLDKETLDALDLESITLVNTHFISPELEESFSDIILSAKLLNSEANCYVSILLEHKSYKDDYVEFQVLSYLSQAYQRQIKNGEQLQLIIPIIYYHGRWSPPRGGLTFLFRHCVGIQKRFNKHSLLQAVWRQKKNSFRFCSPFCNLLFLYCLGTILLNLMLLSIRATRSVLYRPYFLATDLQKALSAKKLFEHISDLKPMNRCRCSKSQ
ncbi:MAG: Rpn family recombination-promoting nuclease/putative transposase [Saprospiraceae bacterium]|nr:Rpn family recombination-promoting nuclease/putative transposase [Saprospiraceae bacterium]